MSIVVQSVNTNLAFSTLISTVNTIAAILSNQIVTANGSAGGSITTGNGFVIGSFGANTIMASLLVGGNVSSTNTVYLGANLNVNNSIITGTSLTINNSVIQVGDVFINTGTIDIGNASVNSTVNSSVIVIGVVNANVVNTTIFSAQTLSAIVSLSVGNASVNSTVNASTLSFGGQSNTINSTSYGGTSNNTAYVGTITAANVVSNAQLQANLANYASLEEVASVVGASLQTLTCNNGGVTPWVVSNTTATLAQVTLTGNTTLLMATNTNPGTYILRVYQPSFGGPFGITWQSNNSGYYYWPQGVKPVLSTGASQEDIFSFVCFSTNGILRGSYATNFG